MKRRGVSMPEAFWLTAAAVLALAGMGVLALAMEVHWGQVMRRPAPSATGIRRMLRGLGALVLLLALLACLKADRPSMAVLVWVMLLSLGALCTALGLAGAAPRSGSAQADEAR